MIQLTDVFCALGSAIFDDNKRLIQLTVIPLSGGLIKMNGVEIKTNFEYAERSMPKRFSSFMVLKPRNDCKVDELEK
jgi:hypothetical protein